MLTFGINTHGPWRTPATSTEFDVFLDTNADGTADAVVYNTRISTTDDFDYFVADLVDLRAGAGFGHALDQQLVNGVDGSFDTNVFNSDSLVMPVSVGVLKDAGLVTGAAPKVRYWVSSYAQGASVDAVGSAAKPMTISLASPGLSAYGDFGTLLNSDLPGEKLEVRRDEATAAVDKPQGLLLLHHLNTNGSRAKVVTVRTSVDHEADGQPVELHLGRQDGAHGDGVPVERRPAP